MIFDSLWSRRASVTAANPRDPIVATWFGGRDTVSGVQVNADTALTLSAVYGCIRILAESIAALPLHLKKRTGNRTEDAIGHPVYAKVKAMPNRWQTSFEWREMMIGHCALRGNAYSEIISGPAAPVRELVPLHPDRVRPFLAPDQSLAYEYSPADGPKRIILAHEMHHLRGLSSDGMVGYDVVDLLRETFGLTLATEKHGAAFFGNGAAPGGVLEHPGKLGEEVQARLIKSWEMRHRGPGNAHRPAVLEEGMKYQSIGIDPERAQLIETRKFQITDIARAFRIPPHMLADLERATFCLPASAKVMTVSGPVSVAEVSEGDAVWSLDGKEWVKRRITAHTMSGVDPILEIKTTNRTLRCNAKHRVLVRRKKPAPKPGQGGYQSVEWQNEYVPAGELSVGDTLVAMHGLPDEGCRDIPTRRNVSRGFMEFCGLLMGDGNVFGGSVSIARSEKATYMDHYRAVMRDEFVSFDGGNGRGNVAVAVRPVSVREGERQTRFSSVMAAQELRDLGLAGNARTKRVPVWVYSLADDLKLAFLRGYLDADGSVDKMGRISFSSVSGDLLDGVRHLCMSLGIPVTNQRLQEGVTTLPNGRRIAFAQYSFTCSDPKSNLRIGSNDPRYTERFLEGKPFDRKERRYPRHGGRGFDIVGCSLSRISSIKVEDPEPVYDITVDGTHNFVADGVVVHNSNIEHQSLEFVVHTLTPWLVRWEQAMARDLLTAESRKSHFFKFDVNGLLRGDIKTRYEAYMQGRQWGWLSVNDIRSKEDMNPVDGGDQYLVPLNMTTPDRIGQDQAPLQQAGAERVARKEYRAIQGALRDTSTFPAWLDGFVQDHARWAGEVMRVDGLGIAEGLRARWQDMPSVEDDYVRVRSADILRYVNGY